MYTFVGASGLWSLLYVGSFLVFCAGLFSVAIASPFLKPATSDPKVENTATFLYLFGFITILIGFSGWCIVSLSEPPTAAAQEAETHLSPPDRYKEISQGDVLAFPAESDLSYSLWHVASASAEGTHSNATYVQFISPLGGYDTATPKELAESGAVIIPREQLKKSASFSDKDLQQEWKEATSLDRWR